MKRQANVVASALRNYERLDEVLNTSIDSMGSAMAEQEEYQKSIQYSLDSLKAAYQGLAQTVMDSDFLKGLIDGGANLLELLDKIIDKVGVLPTILTSLAAVGSFKGVGRPYKPNMPKLVLLRISVRSDTPQNKRAFQMLELRVADTQPKAA